MLVLRFIGGLFALLAGFTAVMVAASLTLGAAMYWLIFAIHHLTGALLAMYGH